MGVKRPAYRSLAALLRRELTRDEDPQTQALIRSLIHVRSRREFSRAEFLLMCRWKSPRALHHYQRNSAVRIRSVSRAMASTLP